LYELGVPSSSSRARFSWTESGTPLKNLFLVERAVRPALAARAVVRGDHDDGVVQLSRLLEVVQEPAELVVRVADEPGEHLGRAREQLPLVLARRTSFDVRPGVLVG
jgi:hypothetical protein